MNLICAFFLYTQHMKPFVLLSFLSAIVKKRARSGEVRDNGRVDIQCLANFSRSDSDIRAPQMNCKYDKVLLFSVRIIDISDHTIGQYFIT